MLKDRKAPREHRQGNLVNLLDLIQRFAEMQYDKDFFQDDQISDKHQTELNRMMRELRQFDITEIGDLYLTSGGRIVLDRGWGEHFDKSDRKIFTLKELTTGMTLDQFKKTINEL